MADVKKNQSKVYNALKGMGFSGIGANEEEFAAKMNNPKNREKVYKALTSKGYKGIGKDQAAFDSLIYQAPEVQPQVAQHGAGALGDGHRRAAAGGMCRHRRGRGGERPVSGRPLRTGAAEEA